MLVNHPRLFATFKYVIYFLLAVNTVYFFLEDFRSTSVIYADGIKPADLIIAFSAFIDTAAWLILLLILELETFVIPDEKLKGKLKWSLTTISLLCYGTIVYAFYGYVGALEVPRGFGIANLGQVSAYCELVKDGVYSFAELLDEYPPLDLENCGRLGADALYNTELQLYATPETYTAIKTLTWTDVVNSGTWLLVVLILELEVILRSSQLVGTKFYKNYKRAKLSLYVVLIVCMFIWLFYGDGWGAWDAFLWLLAFFFIEMNVIAWQEEIAAKRQLETDIA